MKCKVIALPLIAALILTTTACAVRSLDTDEVKVIEKPKTEVVENIDNRINFINNRATEVLTAIKNKDMDSFSKAVHPDKGVRFSAYSYVNESTDVVLINGATHVANVIKLAFK